MRFPAKLSGSEIAGPRASRECKVAAGRCSAFNSAYVSPARGRYTDVMWHSTSPDRNYVDCTRQAGKIQELDVILKDKIRKVRRERLDLLSAMGPGKRANSQPF